jgi:biopolymer transport protein ExbB
VDKFRIKLADNSAQQKLRTARWRFGLFAIIQAAGWPIYPLLLCSVVVLALVIERFLALRQDKVSPTNLLADAISVSQHQLPAADTIQKLEASSHLGNILASGFKALLLDPRASHAAITSHMEDAGRSTVAALEKYLPAIATIASAAPLLGLLGTVVGMIEIFGSQSGSAGGGANPQQLAQGISATSAAA